MALITCAECGARISDRAVTCPSCGAPVAGVQAPSRAPEVASSNQTAEVRRAKTPKWLVVIIVIIGLAVIGKLAGGGGGSSSQSADDARITAELGAEKIVLGFLKAPSTASFVSNTTVQRKGKFFLQRVVVDAHNSFGAKIRSTFLVVLSVSGDKYSWKNEVAAVEAESLPADQLKTFKAINGWVD